VAAVVIAGLPTAATIAPLRGRQGAGRNRGLRDRASRCRRRHCGADGWDSGRQQL